MRNCLLMTTAILEWRHPRSRAGKRARIVRRHGPGDVSYIAACVNWACPQSHDQGPQRLQRHAHFRWVGDDVVDRRQCQCRGGRRALCRQRQAARHSVAASSCRSRQHSAERRGSVARIAVRRRKTPASKAPTSNARLWRGYSQGELSYTYADPKHWSNILVRTEVAAQGTASETVKWKLGARLDYDAVYDLTDFYPSDVRKDQRFDFLLRENYVDIGAGDWDFRLGRQQIVWGEMVGLFFADVVTRRRTCASSSCPTSRSSASRNGRCAPSTSRMIFTRS